MKYLTTARELSICLVAERSVIENLADRNISFHYLDYSISALSFFNKRLFISSVSVHL